jgi:hypothetical protein
MSPNGQETFQVVFPGPVKEQVLRMRDRATMLGLRGAYLHDLKQLHQTLATYPRRAGEPAYRLPFHGTIVRRGVMGMLLVYYAIEEYKRVVFVKSITPVPGHPLGQAE